ncbi:MAG: PLP-dependent aminotransferase family protein [Rhodospirillaceae bacterium]|nr:PLP-dependent aminotransferase family protein [Rhodospirillaceae bacterium]
MDDWFCDPLIRRGEVYLSLADALEQAVRNGRLRPGARLPTHRSLSKRLGVAVSTVTRAYAEAARRGLIESTVGRGTFVRAGAGTQGAVRREGLRPLERLYLPLIQHGDAINLSLNQPLAAGAGERLRTALAELAASAALDDLARYQPPQGRPEHRAAGAAWLRLLGVEARPDEVFAVSGGQTALMTIFLALARPGDTVLTEELTWPGALSVGRLTGIRLAPVTLDHEGLAPDAFEEACRIYRPRLVYTMPTLHNPTTATASEGRRKDIARIARAHNVLIVEDDAYGFLIEPRATSYWQLAPDITVYLTSLSKPIAPALRVGFMAAPPRLLKPLRAAMRATTVMVSPLLLELAARLIDSGAGREAAAAQAAAARRRQQLVAAVLGHQPRATSLHYWLRLPPDMRTAGFVADALANGVAVTPGDAFAVTPGHDPGGVRLCLCAEPDQDRVEQGLRVLARLLHADYAAALPVV